MIFANLLPVKPGQTFSAFAEGWLMEIAPKVLSVENDAHLARTRNELFSSYLPTLTMIGAAYGAQIDTKRKEWRETNAQREKETHTAYTKRETASVQELESMYDFVERLHKDVATRISTSQTFIRTLTDQGRNGS